MPRLAKRYLLKSLASLKEVKARRIVLRDSKQADMTQLEAAYQQQPQQQRQKTPKRQHPFRIRTITVFLELPAGVEEWEREIAAAGTFLGMAQQHLEQLGMWRPCCHLWGCYAF